MNALELEPLITPAAVSWWPLAAGWWFLAALLLSLVLLLKLQPWKRLRHAKREVTAQDEFGYASVHPVSPDRPRAGAGGA